MTNFVYLVEGEPYVGTVEDYARALYRASLCGLHVSDKVWTFIRSGPTMYASVWVAPEVSTSEFDEHDYATVTVRIGEDEASYRVDGRA